jgi:transcriptional regulator with XRE-family HTH domain
MADDPKGPATAGGLLRAARERHGLHIAALAAAMKVAPRKLDALENDRWNELPDATFVRALALTVCRTLKIDAKPVLDLLPPAQTMALRDVGEHLNEPYRDTGARGAGSLAGGAIRPMVWAAAVLMLAAFAVYFMPEAWLKRAAPDAAVAVAPAASAPLAAASAPELPASAAAVAPDGLVPMRSRGRRDRILGAAFQPAAGHAGRGRTATPHHRGLVGRRPRRQRPDPFLAHRATRRTGRVGWRPAHAPDHRQCRRHPAVVPRSDGEPGAEHPRQRRPRRIAVTHLCPRLTP